MAASWRSADKALADYRSADNRPILINTKKVVLQSYLSYLFRLRLLFDDSYLLEELQNVDKKCTQKQSYKTHPLLPETEVTLMFVYFW